MSDNFAASGQSGPEITKNSVDQVAVERVSVVGPVDPVPPLEDRPAEAEWGPPGNSTIRVPIGLTQTEGFKIELKDHLYGRLRQFRSADDTPAGEWKRALSDAKLREISNFLIDAEYQ